MGIGSPVIFFTFLGTLPIPVQLGNIALFSLQLGKIVPPLNLYENTGWKCHGPIPRAIKIIIIFAPRKATDCQFKFDIKFKLAIGCFSWCKCFYMMSNFEDWENIIHFGNFFGSIGKKTYFLALGTTPVKGVGFIAGKITVL